MNDIKRALLGDHEAAKRLTEQGVLLPCGHCGKQAYICCYHSCKVLFIYSKHEMQGNFR